MVFAVLQKAILYSVNVAFFMGTVALTVVTPDKTVDRPEVRGYLYSLTYNSA